MSKNVNACKASPLFCRFPAHIKFASCLLEFFSAVILFALLGAYPSVGQQIGSVLGQPTLQKYINIGGGVDEINTGDLTVHVSIPLASKGSYGPLAITSLNMDSRTYLYNYNQGSGNQIFVNGGFTFGSSARASTGFSFSSGGSGVGCQEIPPPILVGWGAYDGIGTFHAVGAVVNGCNGGISTAGDGWTVGVALTFDTTFGWEYLSEIVSPSGLSTPYSFSPSTTTPCYAYSTSDLHSNSISDNLCWKSDQTGKITGASGSVVDAAKNPVLSASLSQSNVVLLQYPGPNSTTATYKLTFTPSAVNQDFGCGLTVPTSFNAPYLTSIQYPDGSITSLSYELNSLHSGTITGRIASITVPTGAKYSYTYTGGTHGVNCSDGTTSGITKTTPDGQWKITHTPNSGTANISTTTITAPSKDYVIDTMASVPPNFKPQSFVIPQMSTVASLSYSSTGVLLDSTYTCYNTYHPTNATSCATPPSAPSYPITEIDTWHYIPGITNPALKVTTLDSYSRVTDVKTYDFGGTIGSLLFDTDVQTAYGSWDGSSCSNISNSNIFGTYNVMDRVCYNLTFQGCQECAAAAATYNTYGTSGNSFGELVTKQELIGGKLVTVDMKTYDSSGRALTSTGPNGESTSWAYAECGGQQLSSVSVKTNASGSELTTSYSGYDCVGEKDSLITDENSNPSSSNYGTDPYWRPISTTDAAGVVTNYTYKAATGSSPATIDVQRTIVSGSSSEEVLTEFDSMGREKLIQLCQTLPPCSKYTITETDYDSDGRVARVSLPYSGVAGTLNSTIAGTKTTYDGLGRPLTVTGPAYTTTIPGATTSYTYKANDVLVTQSPAPTGEHLKARQSETNGLGEITSVCEITSQAGIPSCGQSTAANGYLTTYKYYAGGKLESITQNATGTQQVRSFTYDNNDTGRLLTSTSPESGTITTTYDSDPGNMCAPFIGLPVKTVDNAGNTTCFQYDLADRITLETFAGPNSLSTGPKGLLYDNSSNPHLSCTKANASGNLVEVATGLPGTGAVTIGGSEQSIGGSGTNSTGWVNINMYLGQVTTAGNIAINVNSSQVASYHFSAGEPGDPIAQALSTEINSNQGAPVTSTGGGSGSGPGTVYLTSKNVGANTNYPLSATCQYISGASCSGLVGTSGPNMTGGTGSGTIYDTGSVWITVNNVQTSVNYGASDSSVSIATALVNGINANGSLPITATLSGSTINLILKTGQSATYTFSSGSSTSQPSVFSSPSFTATAALGTLASDELLCYDPDGRPTDRYIWTSSGYNTYGHVIEAYYANGVPKSISWAPGSWPTPTPPTVSYSLDPMSRPYSVSDSNGNTLVSSTTYYLDNKVNTVLFGNGDTSVYTEYANFAPHTETHTVGTSSNNTVEHNLTWNSNGTLRSLQTIDKPYPANSQTCTFLYDDLVRVTSDNCGANWNESFAYDPFGNVTKSGSLPWPPPGVTYGQTNNQYYKSSGSVFSYDGNGRLLNDTFDSLTWDVNGNLASQTGISFQYDALNRTVSAVDAGVPTSYVYAPDGALIATLSGSPQTFSKLLIELPASRAVYTGSSLSLSHIDHYDWQNSARVSSTWSRTFFNDVSYDAFGVPYWSTGTINSQFAELRSDVSSGTELVSDSRRYHPSQGRWESPDDAIPDPYNPQSLNAYHYSLNMPTTIQDPSGRDEQQQQALSVTGQPVDVIVGTCFMSPECPQGTDQSVITDWYVNLSKTMEETRQQEQSIQNTEQQMAQQDINSTAGFGRISPGAQAQSGSGNGGTGVIGAPSFGWSLVPVVGSGWQAIHDFQTGHWGWGLFNAGVAISDVFLVDAALTAGPKLLARGIAALGEKSAIGESGKMGEAILRDLVGGESAFFRTGSGKARFVDAFAKGVAHESKVGRTSLTEFVRQQIAKDVELRAAPESGVQKVVWHFFTSPLTGRIGPTNPLRAALRAAGIAIVLHP